MKNKFYWKELQVKHSYTIYKDHLEVLCDIKSILTLAKDSKSHQSLSILGIKINVFAKFIQIRIKLKPFSKPFRMLI
ncbi:hypothetical protein OSB04_028070 [Centaurea solstitialis]|uniref:Uncharacterized protein n=1 Tax=Centaurea solstitialis TaxID=347529 RepID=A0AA38W8V9_9ASTR|nr:hypothetical protein OSB04_028070 [Centaurea solstitialis]